MEKLKRLEELVKLDTRQRSFVKLTPEDPNFYYRHRTIEDIYEDVSSIVLDAVVPDEIRSHFATALNLVAYSWYFYPFNTTAQFMAYVTVERALRTHYANDVKLPFKALLSRAVRDCLIKESGFSHRQSEQKPNPVLGVEFGIPDGMDYADALVEILPSLRNQIAHGETRLHPHGYFAVRICAELINQFFANVNMQKLEATPPDSPIS